MQKDETGAGTCQTVFQSLDFLPSAFSFSLCNETLIFVSYGNLNHKYLSIFIINCRHQRRISGFKASPSLSSALKGITYIGAVVKIIEKLHN